MNDPQTMPSLLPCAHCGGSAKIDRTSGHDERSGYNFDTTIQCMKCPASVTVGSLRDSGGWCKDNTRDAEIRATAAWNTRHIASPTISEEIMRHRPILSSIRDASGVFRDHANMISSETGDYVLYEDHVAALEAAGLGGDGAWIGVNERMPELGVPVLAVGHVEDRPQHAVYSIAYRTEREDGGDVDGWIDLHHTSESPTHWRPLPSLPKGPTP
jgi:hypothetical protein